ncbi:unnamed protein product [Effrenium voratum]|nr:unnamed protein product [Effrenium voratum]
MAAVAFSASRCHAPSLVLQASRVCSGGFRGSRGVPRGSLAPAVSLLTAAAFARGAARRRRMSSLAALAAQVKELGLAEENLALVFVKPHACTPKVLQLVPDFLRESGLQVLRSGSVGAKTIEEQGIIDAHYAAIAKVGMARDLSTLGLEGTAAKFEAGYGRSLDDALAKNEVCSAVTAMEVLQVDPSELLRRCLAAGYEKLRSGLYCARLEGGETGQLFVLNGFYARMREKFTSPGVTVHWHVVGWPQSQLPWADFRGQVIGSTNPVDAVDGSLRARIRDSWENLGLEAETNYQDNGVHASAGPLEALRERMVWLGDDIESDPFGRLVIERCSLSVKDLVENPVIQLDGKTGPAFDLLEELDCKETLEALASAKL